MATKKDYKHTPRKEKLAKVEELIDKDTYTPEEAVELLPKISISNFVGSANLDVLLSLKEKQANESIRGSIVFPNQFAEEKVVVVFAEGDKQKEAKEAGADHVGLDELVEKISKGWTDFDVVIAQPATMPKIAKLGKILGPKQLMPNPKTGTVTDNVADTVKNYKAGKMDFKMDEGKSIKLRFGKLDMKKEELLANLNAALDAIKAEAKRLGPDSIRKVYVTPAMGPKLELTIE
jgi:large subunit ribosomal protein L1